MREEILEMISIARKEGDAETEEHMWEMLETCDFAEDYE